MVSVWWSSAGIINHSFLKPGSIITVSVYCKQLQEMMDQLKSKQPKLVNHPILLQDIARPHTAKMTRQKLHSLGIETIRHPPYSPDLSPTNYYLFRKLELCLRGKKFNSEDDVKSAFQVFIDSQDRDSSRIGIEKLPVRW